MSGGMVCMSRPLALRLATDQHFGHFIEVARERNTAGVPCRHGGWRACASQPPERKMWHHEDAGIGYNVFRAVVAGNGSMNYMAAPAHYNDAGIIERSVPLSPADEYWSTRAIFAHGIKTPAHFSLIKQRWNVSRPDAAFDKLACWPCDQLPRGANIHVGNWPWARVPCPQQQVGIGRFCGVKPQSHFKCCSFPWTIPPSMKDRAGAAEAARRAAKEWNVWRKAQDREGAKRRGGSLHDWKKRDREEAKRRGGPAASGKRAAKRLAKRAARKSAQGQGVAGSMPPTA